MKLFLKHFLNIAISIFLGGMIFYQHLDMNEMKRELRKKDVEIYQLQTLIDWDSRKTKFVLTARDSVIKKHHKKLSDKEAFDIAYFTFTSCLRRKIDPILMLAMARRESRFDTKAVSSAGAEGIVQIMPNTARVLCDGLGITYVDGMLFDYKINIELATKYVDYLRADYQDIEEILIGYNAGPKWIKIYRNQKRLPQETVDYIEAVKNYYKEFQQHLAIYIPEQAKIEG